MNYTVSIAFATVHPEFSFCLIRQAELSLFTMVRFMGFPEVDSVEQDHLASCSPKRSSHGTEQAS